MLVVDGACEPNPGDMAWAAVLYRVSEDGLVKIAYEYDERGHGTNNEAELVAMRDGLRWAVNYCAREEQSPTCHAAGQVSPAMLRAMYSDSQIAVRCVTGEWTSRAQNLRPLVKEVAELCQTRGVAVGWIPGWQIGEAHDMAQGILRSHSAERIAPPPGIERRK